MSRDSNLKVISVAFLLCLVCSILVSLAAVGLSDRQQSNKEAEKKKNILLAAGIYDESQAIESQFSQIQSYVVDLETGEFLAGIDAQTFDSQAAERDPETRYEIATERDLAGIKVRSRTMDVYLVRDGEALKQLILPIHGKGLWSTMYGFISLAADLNTVTGLTFYEHGETPGLGGEIDNPAWQKQWQGKKIYDATGQLRIEVIKGTVAANAPDAEFQADGLAGATLTARGVSNLVQYWLSDDGFRPLLERLKSEGGAL
jgi:Na+-transporting NADH:ubiquinone oxidoreductase subunit C